MDVRRTVGTRGLQKCGLVGRGDPMDVAVTQYPGKLAWIIRERLYKVKRSRLMMSLPAPITAPRAPRKPCSKVDMRSPMLRASVRTT